MLRKEVLVISHFSISRVDKSWFVGKIQPIACFFKEILWLVVVVVVVVVGVAVVTPLFTCSLGLSSIRPQLKRNRTNFPLSWWKSMI